MWKLMQVTMSYSDDLPLTFANTMFGQTLCATTAYAGASAGFHDLFNQIREGFAWIPCIKESILFFL
jgi:hypothetical protein